MHRPTPSTRHPRRFPAKLYDLVDGHSQVPEEQAVVTWCENGLAFIVRDLNRFCEEVLPAHFCHNKWASFIRQLNLYGFRRITQGQSSGAYWHKFFQRGEPHLLRGIKRSRRQGSGAKKKAVEPEPSNHSTGRYATRQQHDDLSAGWGSGAPSMHTGVPLPPMSAVLPQLPPPPIISDEALLSELDGLVQAQKAQHGGQAAALSDAAAGHMRPPPPRVDSAGLLGNFPGSGASRSKFLDSAPLNDGLRKRMASHQSIHSVGSLGQMTEIGGHGPPRQKSSFQAGRRTTSKSSLASDDWDLNIADVDSLNLDDWRWSESQNGANLGAFGAPAPGNFLRARDPGLAGMGGFGAGLPTTDLPRQGVHHGHTPAPGPISCGSGGGGGLAAAPGRTAGAADVLVLPLDIPAPPRVTWRRD